MNSREALVAAREALLEERRQITELILNLDRMLGVPAALGQVHAKGRSRKADDAVPSPTTKGRRARRPARAQKGGAARAIGPGKLAGKEEQVKAAWLVGEANPLIGARFGVSGEAIRLLAQKHGWKRPEVPIRRLPRGVSGRPEA